MRNSIKAVVNGCEISYDGMHGLCVSPEVAKDLAAYVEKYQLAPVPSGAESRCASYSIGGRRIIIRWDSAMVVTEVGTCKSDVHSERYWRGDWADRPIPQDKSLQPDTAGKTAPASEGFSSVPVYRVEPANGESYWFAYRTKDGAPIGDYDNCWLRCANRSVAEAVCAADNKAGRIITFMNMPDARVNDGYFTEGGSVFCHMENGVVVEYRQGTYEENEAAYDASGYGRNNRRKLLAWSELRLPDEESDKVKPVPNTEKKTERKTLRKPNDAGFLSETVYKLEPANRKYYWFAVRTRNGAPVGELRCANRAVAEAVCASDMRCGRGVSSQSQGHFMESGERYIRMERGLITECVDLGNYKENRDYFYKRSAEYGDCKTGNLADPDPVTQADSAPDSVWAEMVASQTEFARTGVIPKPSTELMFGYQKSCDCGICGYLRKYQQQETEKGLNRAAEALVTTAAAIKDQKKVQQVEAKDLYADANVAQSTIKSEVTNKEIPTMANEPKPVRVLSQLELEAQAAALRTAMRQLTKLIHEPLAAALAAQLTPAGGDPAAMKAKVGEFLKSEIGSALVASLLSLGISSIPANVIPGLTQERQASASRELRIGAMTAAGDTLLDLVMEPLRNVLVGLASGPAAEALTGVRAADVGLEDAQQETVEAATVQSEAVKKVNF